VINASRILSSGLRWRHNEATVSVSQTACLSAAYYQWNYWRD